MYNSSGNKKNELITDENGVIRVNLPYGKYKLHQTTTKKGYKYSSDFEFSIENTNEINKELLDEEVTAKLKVIKIDKDTKQVIKRANIKFKIYDVNKKEYVCQMLNNNKICEFKTDSNGIMITPQVLYSGKYKLVEVDQAIDGYTWNSESVIFEIDENTKLKTDNEEGILFETKFENKRVLGNLEITKYGEELQYLEQGYQYNEIKLSGVKIGLYQNDKLIKEYTTNEEGKIIINGLELGKYTLKEIATVNDHVLDNTEYEVNIKYKDQYTEVVNKKINEDVIESNSFMEEIKKNSIDRFSNIRNDFISILKKEKYNINYIEKNYQYYMQIKTDKRISKYHRQSMESKYKDFHMEYDIKDEKYIVNVYFK